MVCVKAMMLILLFKRFECLQKIGRVAPGALNLELCWVVPLKLFVQLNSAMFT
jgi:hypothetical protein